MDLHNPYKVLIVQIGRLGDMILTTPLFYELERLYPHWEISVLCSPENEKIIKHSGVIKNIYVYNKNLIKSFSLIRKLKKENFDFWIDTKPEFSDTSRMLLKYCAPKKSFGYNLVEKIFQVDLTRFKKGNHYTDINLSVLKYFDSSYNPLLHRQPVIQIPDDIETENIDIPGDKFKIILNVSSGQKSRIWQKEKWLELMISIDKNHNCFFIIHYLSKEKQIIDFIRNHYDKNNCHYLEDIDIYKFACIIKKSDLVITPDTSAVHIASAFDIPVIGLYANVKWNYERFKSLSSVNEAVFSKNEKDISDITVDEVLEKFKRICGNAESRTRVQKEDH
jgi:ADP-heptose:LPS heptosyltransferase